MNSGTTAREININGIVQGVGFRPCVYRLARRRRLCGEVANTSRGVTIVLEGLAVDIDGFIADLEREKPPLAHMVEIVQQDRPVGGYRDFTISPSQGSAHRATLVSPDVAVCDDCLKELFDPHDRRFGYPFINCTNCGPRYTIIDDIPYDRAKTAMRGFTMCPQCQAEYDDPEDRRYHAQPNACALCGPLVSLFDAGGGPVAADDPIERAAQLIREGHVLGVKGLGGFHLAADALNDDAVARLRERKHREEKPLAVMAPDLDTIASFAQMTPDDVELLTTIQRPIVLLPKRLPERLAFSVAPRNHYYGVMLPYTPLHHLLLSHGFTAVVMTSGNLSEEPIAIDNDEAFQRLGAIADYFLVHDRPIRLRSDDSIVRRSGGKTRPLRRSRGFVPVPVFLKDKLPMILACGAELKNTVCLTKGNQAFVSQHIGDLENLATEDFFRLTIDHLQRILDIEPQAIACDMHPDYLNTRWAEAQEGLPVIQVQHHHAHVAACMAEHHLEGEVIGLAFDGTGYGPDGTVWGGEALVADQKGYRRAAHLACVPMPGAAAAIKAPWRLGLAYLHHAYGEQLWKLGLPFLEGIDKDQARTVVQMAVNGINAPLTSSLGRLFDAVAVIIGLRGTVAYEGQAAMELEMVADGNEQGSYPFVWSDDTVKQVAVAPIIKGVVEDILAGVPAFVISRRFHDTLVAMWSELCGVLRDETGFDRVVFSGGCFQNVLLLEGLSAALKQKGLQVFSHEQVPTNDGGISLGQAVVAAGRLDGVS